MALKIVSCLLMSTIGKRYVTITAVCVDVHMSDNRQTLCDSENNNNNNNNNNMCTYRAQSR